MSLPLFGFVIFLRKPKMGKATPEGVPIRVRTATVPASRAVIEGQKVTLFGEDGESLGQFPIKHGFSYPPDMPVEVR